MRGVVLGGLLTCMLGLAACGSSGTDDQSSKIEDNIKSTGASQLQSELDKSIPQGGAASVNDADCVETGDTQNYTCRAHYTINAPQAGLNNQKYLLNITGTCDDSGKCQWHAAGNGIPVPN